MPFQDTEKILELVSNETLKSINSFKIVTPTIYKSAFPKNAAAYDEIAEDEEKLTNLLLSNQIAQFQQIQDKTHNNAIKLSDSTSKAISAIENKDTAQLSEVLKETQELRKEIDKLKDIAYKDELTRVYNRRWLSDHILQDDREKLSIPGVLVILDLNYFKLVNDNYGHTLGDKVLIYIANKLKETKQAVIRYGGDEFIILFSEDFTEAKTTKIFQDMRDEILRKKIKAKDSSFHISFSFGIEKFNIDENITDIIEKADKKMYQDKLDIKKIITGI
jgi:diguanylate cyclase (GGDEF)-like protein